MGFDPTQNVTAPYSPGSDTSKDAAEFMQKKTGSQMCAVIRLLIESGQTRHEISKKLGIKDSAADARVWQLKDEGFVYDSSETRPTDTGRSAHVVKLTEFAVELLYADKDLFDKIQST